MRDGSPSFRPAFFAVLIHAKLRNMTGLRAAALEALLLASLAGGADPPASPCLRAAAAMAATEEPALVEQVEDARRRFEANPGQADLAGRLGMIFHAYELLDPAQACYAEVVDLAPQDVRWRYYHAIVLSAQGRTARARAEIDRVLAAQPELVPAVVLRAELLALSGAMSQSEADWRRALELQPNSSAAHCGLGRALAAQGRHQESIASFRRSIDIDPNPRASYGLALAYRRTGRDDEAAKALAAYRNLDQNATLPPDPWMDQVRALNRSVRNQVALGAQLARAGRTEEAIEIFTAILKSSPDLAVAHANLVALYAQAGEMDKAAEHYRRAIAADPHQADAHLNWAGALVQQGHWREALAPLEQAVSAAPHAAQARLLLGQVYERLDRSLDALQQYAQASAGDPLNRDAQRLLGGALVAAGRIEEGLDALEKAVDVDEGRAADYMEGLSRSHEADGRLELALGYARRALRRGPEDDLASRLRQAIARLEAKLEAAR